MRKVTLRLRLRSLYKVRLKPWYKECARYWGQPLRYKLRGQYLRWCFNTSPGWFRVDGLIFRWDLDFELNLPGDWRGFSQL